MKNVMEKRGEIYIMRPPNLTLPIIALALSIMALSLRILVVIKGDEKMPDNMECIDHIPTDGEIIDIINAIERDLGFFKNLLKLNEKGRKEALIYMFGLLHFPEYRYSAKRRVEKINREQKKT